MDDAINLALCLAFPSIPETSSRNAEWRVKSLNLNAMKLQSKGKLSSTLSATAGSTAVLGECVLVVCLQLHDGRRHSTQQIHVWNVRFHGIMGSTCVERGLGVSILSIDVDALQKHSLGVLVH